MRRSLAAASLVAILVACSGTDEPSCRIAGSYTMTATPEIATEGCADLPPPAPVALTITERPPDVSGPDFALEIQGVSGACAVTRLEACKVQSKCDITLIDATDPANSIATLQVTWTFTDSGFTGINSGSFPAAKSLPRGCVFTSKATATRR